MRAVAGTDLLICPICRADLPAIEGAFACANRHSFDRARDGYVNLRLTKRTGDSKEMLLARRAFLQRGHYEPLAQVVNELGCTYLTTAPGGGRQRYILDVGCGEGYYLAQLAQHLIGTPVAGSYAYLGIDSAKHAVKLAGRRCPGTLFVVADVQEGLPVAGSKMHLLLNIFAPRNIPEFARVLVPGGLLLTVIPTPNHLLELRTALNLLEIEEHKLERLVERLGESFDVVEIRMLDYTMHLERDDLVHLVTMTPNFRHTERRSPMPLDRWEGHPITAAFTILACRRR